MPQLQLEKIRKFFKFKLDDKIDNAILLSEYWKKDFENSLKESLENPFENITLADTNWMDQIDQHSHCFYEYYDEIHFNDSESYVKFFKILNLCDDAYENYFKVKPPMYDGIFPLKQLIDIHPMNYEKNLDNTYGTL